VAVGGFLGEDNVGDFETLFISILISDNIDFFLLKINIVHII